MAAVFGGIARGMARIPGAIAKGASNVTKGASKASPKGLANASPKGTSSKGSSEQVPQGQTSVSKAQGGGGSSTTDDDKKTQPSSQNKKPSIFGNNTPNTPQNPNKLQNTVIFVLG